MIIQKFGGSSIGNAERIQKVCSIISKTFVSHGSKDDSLVVVVSAVGGITDLLINCAQCENDKEKEKQLAVIITKHLDILKDLNLAEETISDILKELAHTMRIEVMSAQTMDIVQSYGERLSSRIVAGCLSTIGIQSKAYDAFDIGFVTNDEFGNAEITPATYPNIRKKLHHFTGVPVVTGFIAKNEAGEITTLGRGGSDYTAAIIGAALNASEVQIWTDVNGIMTADPRVVKDKAKTIPVVSITEASELAYFGAKVLHPKTILPVMNKNIPVKILNTFEPNHPGTIIVNHLKEADITPVKAITFKRKIQVINISSLRMLDSHGFLARVFDIFGKYKVVVDMISTSEVSISVTVDDKVNVSKVIEELKEFSKVTLEKNKSLLCLVGEKHKYTPGMAGKVFSILGKENINVEMISQGASEVNISFVIDNSEIEKAVLKLHAGFFE